MPKVDLMAPVTRPGKFEGEPRMVELLYEMDADQEFGDVEYGGFYRLFVRLSPLDFTDRYELKDVSIGKTRAVIMREDSDGFIASQFFTSDAAAEKKWASLEAKYGEEYGGDEYE